MKVQFHPDAEEELYEAVAWYEDRRSGLGFDLLAEVGRWQDILIEAPLAWPRWPEAPRLDPPVRRVLTRRFPFAIAYQVFDERVLVLAVADTSRRPFYGAERETHGDLG